MINLKNHFKYISAQINNLPDKLNFKIGETGKIIGVPNYVLRYWEKEFAILNPEKFTNQQRLYSKKDIEILFLIKSLLYKEKFSIEGLRKHLTSYCRKFKQYKKESCIRSNPIEKKVYQLLDSITEIRTTINQPPS